MFKLIVQDEEGCVIYGANVHSLPGTGDEIQDGRNVVTTVAGWIKDATGQQVRCKGCGHTWTVETFKGTELCPVCIGRDRWYYAEPVTTFGPRTTITRLSD